MSSKDTNSPRNAGSSASRVRRPLRALCAAIFITVGVRHLTDPGLFLPMMPPVLPAPGALVFVSGVASVFLGVCLLVPGLRTLARWGLLAFLVAVFPANVYAAMEGIHLRGLTAPDWVLWARLPGQALMMAWVWWATREAS